MSEFYIVKWIPDWGFDTLNQIQQIIHKIELPSYGEKGHYNEMRKWDGFAHGKRRNATKQDKEIRRTGCTWAPNGLYYCHDWNEKSWISLNQKRVEHLKEMGLSDAKCYAMDDRNLPVVTHCGMDAFFAHIQFDRFKRRYLYTVD